MEHVPQGIGQERHWKWNKGNWWCPKSGSVLVPQTTDVDALKAAVDGFELSDGTGTDHGILWGFKMLSPDWAGKLPGAVPGRPASYLSDTIKVMLVMTDGGITAQYTPDQSALEDGEPPFKTGNDTEYGRSTARAQFQTICDTAKANGVIVHTVGVEVDKSWALQDMEKCATSSSHYFDVESDEMETTFETIATSINTPRLTQ